MVYRFAAGGMENVIVQLINHLPHDQFRHSIIALTDADPSFVSRISRSDVEIVELHKPPGQPFRLFPKAYRVLRRMRPDVLQTFNLAALEFMPVAATAGIRRRIHAEHGWDVRDPDGSNKTFQWLRRIYRPFVHEYVVVSRQLGAYLDQRIGVPADRVHLIPNGVDTRLFRPHQAGDQPPRGFPFRRGEHWVIGTVGRLVEIKNQALLIKAFAQLVAAEPEAHARLRLAIVGDGPLGDKLRALAADAGVSDRLWMPGSRADVAEILRSLDVFVLPSFAEGTSCTLQEAMASQLPIIATDVGGNADLLDAGRLGTLVGSNDVVGLCRAMLATMKVADRGRPGSRAEVENMYSLDAVMARYQSLFHPQRRVAPTSGRLAQ
jgi:sugar transferase (PEP-CTERM/EpsH1 system associated)